MVKKPQTLTPEEVAEIEALPDLAAKKSDGLLVLAPANIAAPLTKYGKDVEPIPTAFTEAADYAAAFVRWQLARAPKTSIEKWSTPEAADDAHLYIRRKIWDAKSAAGQIQNGAACVIATTAAISADFRNVAHEAINSACKHNADAARLVDEIHDRVDATIQQRMDTAMLKIVGAAAATVPQLHSALQRVLLEDQSPNSE